MQTAAKKINIPSLDTGLQNSLHKELGISPVLAKLLINRGIRSCSQADNFLNVKLDNLSDPYLFSDMHKAVSIILRAAKNKDRVMIFGDYDVDGVSSVALLKNTLLKIGLNASYYLPHRIKEGYGLSKNVLHIAKENKIKVLITVDCGTSSLEEVKALRQAGIEVIITDHHEPAQAHSLEAEAVINPKLKGSGYGFRDLSGVGVAYKLCQALTKDKLEDELDLVALGTIADVVPLLGENRIIVRYGLVNFMQTKKAGLKALMENSGIKNKKLTATTIAYIIAPRINASGRMDTGEQALKLLMAQDAGEALELSKALETYNRQRQKIENQIMEEAINVIESEVNFRDHKVIVVASDGWHQGVLGIVASKLADRFYRPAIVISSSAELCKGSGRSIKNFHLFEALLECQDLLHAFGGHSHAVGLNILKSNIEGFKKRINRVAQEKLTFEDLLPTLEIDAKIALSDITESLAQELELLEPYGMANPEPLFLSCGLKLKGAPQVLGRETLKFWVSDGEFTYQAIGFGMAGLKESLLNAGSFDLVFTPRMDYWQGTGSLLLEAKDIFLRPD